MKTTFGIWQHSAIVTSAAIPRTTGRALGAVGDMLVTAGQAMNKCGDGLIASAATRTEASVLRLEELRRRRSMTPMELEAAEIGDLEVEICDRQDAIIDADNNANGASLSSIKKLVLLQEELRARQDRMLRLEEEYAKVKSEDKTKAEREAAAITAAFAHLGKSTEQAVAPAEAHLMPCNVAGVLG